jgi:hypothetical protein
MFKKKPKYKSITSVKQIKGHLREFILDSQIPDADEVSSRLGCPPISDEVLEREEDESEIRIERISFLIPLLYGYGKLFSEVFAESIAGSKPKKGSPVSDHPSAMVTPVTMGTLEEIMSHLLIGSVSQMVDLGLLQLPKGKK